MKLISAVVLGIFMFMATSVSLVAAEQDPFAHITQDRVDLELDSGNLFFNDEPVSAEQLEERLSSSYSVALTAGSAGEQSVVPAAPLLSVLEKIHAAGIEPGLVNLSLELPVQLKRGQYHKVQLTGDVEVLLNGSAELGEKLGDKSMPGRTFVILPLSKRCEINYLNLLSVLQSIGGEAELAGLSFSHKESVEVEAQIISIQADGSSDILSAPRMTVAPGKLSMIRVVENASGSNLYAGEDLYHQEDLANLGVRLSARPQLIGDYIRVSGAVILTRMEDRQAVFKEGKHPVASYSSTKLVVPFSFVFPPGADSVKFDGAEIDGRTTSCILKAVIVDDKGMTRKERQVYREATIRQQ